MLSSTHFFCFSVSILALFTICPASSRSPPLCPSSLNYPSPTYLYPASNEWNMNFMVTSMTLRDVWNFFEWTAASSRPNEGNHGEGWRAMALAPSQTHQIWPISLHFSQTCTLVQDAHFKPSFANLRSAVRELRILQSRANMVRWPKNTSQGSFCAQFLLVSSQTYINRCAFTSSNFQVPNGGLIVRRYREICHIL